MKINLLAVRIQLAVDLKTHSTPCGLVDESSCKVIEMGGHEFVACSPEVLIDDEMGLNVHRDYHQSIPVELNACQVAHMIN